MDNMGYDVDQQVVTTKLKDKIISPSNTDKFNNMKLEVEAKNQKTRLVKRFRFRLK